jgi:hypothetical protein
MKSTANEASQLKAKRAQAAAGLAEKQRELAIALKELADVRYARYGRSLRQSAEPKHNDASAISNVRRPIT